MHNYTLSNFAGTCPLSGSHGGTAALAAATVDTSMPQTASPAELAQRCGLAAGVSLDPQGGPALDSENGEAATGNFSDVALVLSEAHQGPGTLFVTSRCTHGHALSLVGNNFASLYRRANTGTFSCALMFASLL